MGKIDLANDLKETPYHMGVLYEKGPPLTAKQLAKRWGCSEPHVMKLVHANKIKHFRPGERVYRISSKTVIEWEDSEWEGIGQNTPSENIDLEALKAAQQ